MGIRRVVLGVVVAAVAVAMLVLPASTGQATQRIMPQTFGIHSFSTDPGVPAGSIRMNCWPTWRHIEPKQNKYHWGIMDAALNRVRAWGFSDVLFVFCGTPQWAAAPVPYPQHELSEPGFGPGSTGAPARISDWRDFVTAVVRRYRGRIDHYQVWNEVTSQQFYQGSTRRMATMTKVLYDVVATHDPAATVVAGSLQTHAFYRSKGRHYLKALRARGWPVDAVAGSFYPPLKGGPNAQRQQIARFTADLRRYDLPRRVEQWQTESNFWTGVPGNPPEGRVRGARAAMFLARNYLDTWAAGLSRSYWYMWSNRYEKFPGVQLRASDPATRAYRTLARWTVGSRFVSCTPKRTVVRCRFRAERRFTIAYTVRGKATLAVAGRKKVCPVTGSRCRVVRNKVTVGRLPVRIR